MTAMPHQILPVAPILASVEGRWPRICEERDSQPLLRVAMLSMHTSPLAQIGKTRDAGGMNVYIRNLAAALGHRQIAVDIFTRWTDPTLPQILNITQRTRVIHIPAGPIAPLHKNDLPPFTAQFAEGIDCFAISQRLDYQIIHSHYWLSGMAGIELATMWGAPHLTMFHTLATLKQLARPAELEPRIRVEGERRIIREVDGIIAATTHEQHHIAEYYHRAAATIETIPCGVDIASFTPDYRAEARARIVARHAINPSKPILLSVGRLDPLKGPDLLIHMLRHMRHEATLLLVGGDEHDPQRCCLQALASELGISHRIKFIDAVPQHDLLTYYRATDLFFIASHYESFGLVAVEALASGTPVIAPRIGGIPTIIRHGVNGILLEDRDPVLFAKTADDILADPVRLAGMAAMAPLTVQRFGWQRIARQMHHTYDIYAREDSLAFCQAD